MQPGSNGQQPGPQPARRTNSIERSAIREMFDLAQKYDDKDLVHMEIGEPDFDTPAHIIEAATDAVKNGATHYTSNAGLPALREAVANDITVDHQYDPKTNVIITAGAMEALALAFLTLVNPGDEVVVPTPAWPNYHTQTMMAGGKYVDVALDRSEGFALETERIVDAITDDTAVVMLTTPSNPTGQVYEGEAAARVVTAAAEHNAVVIADEVYKDLIYDGNHRSVADSATHPEYVVTLGSCSKTYAMTGWRVGWLAGPKSIIDEAMKFHESVVACAPAVSQHAALAALTGDRSPVQEMYDIFQARRDFLVERVTDLPSISCPVPEGAFYAFLDMSAVGRDSTTIAKCLLEEYGVVTAPGIGFGSNTDNHLRISFANNQDRLGEGFDRISQFLAAEGIQ